MRRITMLLLLSLALLWPVASQAAAIDHGQLCWTATPFADTLRVWVIENPGGRILWAFPTAAWVGGTSYQLVGNSAAATAVPATVPATLQVAPFNFINATPFFGGNPLCRLESTLVASTGNGTWVMTCTTVPAPAMPFQVSGQLTFLGPCDGPLTVEEQDQQTAALQDRTLAGAPENNEYQP